MSLPHRSLKQFRPGYDGVISCRPADTDPSSEVTAAGADRVTDDSLLIDSSADKVSDETAKEESKSAVSTDIDHSSSVQTEKTSIDPATAAGWIASNPDIDRSKLNSDGILRDVSMMEEILLTNPTAISAPLPAGIKPVKGPDFNKGRSIDHILESLMTTGFQATALAQAVERIKEMISWRLTPEEKEKDPTLSEMSDSDVKNARATIFLGITSNMISSGLREVICYLCKHNMIDCIVTTSGAVEEDIMKCFSPHYLADFALKGRDLRVRGINRIGNLVVPNTSYCLFEGWLKPILNEMIKEQIESEKMEYHHRKLFEESDAGKSGHPYCGPRRIVWTPSKLLRRMGKEINDERSVWYWCYRNNIPVFCPGITDGAVGDVFYFLSYYDDRLIMDVSRDVRFINDIALQSIRSGVIILGGGIIKHHIMNANLMRNGADWTVYLNTGQAFEGSDSGAPCDEAVSWGKIKLDSKPVKVYGEATMIFPFMVAGSFAHPDYVKLAEKPFRPLHESQDIEQLE